MEYCLINSLTSYDNLNFANYFSIIINTGFFCRKKGGFLKKKKAFIEKIRMAFFLDNYITRNYIYENNIFKEKKRCDKISNIIIVILPESTGQTFSASLHTSFNRLANWFSIVLTFWYIMDVEKIRKIRTTALTNVKIKWERMLLILKKFIGFFVPFIP